MPIVPPGEDAAAGPAGMLWTVQLLRAAAAVMVVFGHSQSAVALLKQGVGEAFVRSTILPWGVGVDLFFVISGFIMMHASKGLFGRRDAPIAFVRRRLARIAPLYWSATALYLALLGVAHLKGGDPFPEAASVLASLLFIPADSWGDGRVLPVFDLGWTLNYEMFFYALFAVAVLFPRRRAAALLAGAVVALVLLGTAIPVEWEASRFWTRPIMLDFVLGVGLGLASVEGVRLPAVLRVLLVAGATLVLAVDPGAIYAAPLGATVPNEWPRVLGGGLPAAALLAGAVLGPQPRLTRPLRPLERLGDASYSLYLFHPFVMIAVGKLWQKAPVVRALPGWLLVFGMVAAAIMLALIVHRWLERPLTSKARQLLGGGPSRPRAPVRTLAGKPLS